MADNRGHEAHHLQRQQPVSIEGAIVQPQDVEQRKQARRQRPLRRIEEQHKIPRPVPEHAANIGRAGILATDLEDIHALPARDEVPEGQCAQQIPAHGCDEERDDHAPKVGARLRAMACRTGSRPCSIRPVEPFLIAARTSPA